MSRPFVFLLLIVCLLGQSLAAAHVSVRPGGGGGIEHRLLHWQGEAHHHHHGGVQLDESAASDAHMLADHLGCCTAMPPPSAPALQGQAPAHQLPGAPATRLSAPVLDGPLRPPKA